MVRSQLVGANTRSKMRIGPVESRGTSMMEVLVSMIVMAFGILGLASMQLVAINSNENASERSEATLQTYSILDSMRVNAEIAKAGGYNTGEAPICNVPVGSTLAQIDLQQWIQQLKKTLGESACAGIACSATSCTAVVQWESSLDSEESRLSIATRL